MLLSAAFDLVRCFELESEAERLVRLSCPLVLFRCSISGSRAESPRNPTPGTSIFRLTSRQALKYTSVITLHAAGPFSAVLVLADKAMLWQYMFAAKATPTVKTATTMAPGAC